MSDLAYTTSEECSAALAHAKETVEHQMTALGAIKEWASTIADSLAEGGHSVHLIHRMDQLIRQTEQAHAAAETYRHEVEETSAIIHTSFSK